MKALFIFFAMSFIINSYAQTRIDSSMAFQTDPNKKYSIYVPSTYNSLVPNKLMLGLHPFNTARWNSETWCDTLINFSEANGLILICPDGGADGQVDDAIDTAFTTVILDSMLSWYTIDQTKIFAMGFSWGGKTTYSYGLRRINRFAGFMPIGAVITTNEVNSVISNANGKPFYLIHGSQDNPNGRYTAMLNILDANHACTNGMLLSGVGHTIDFANRDQILTNAFNWLDTVSCQIFVEDTTSVDSTVFITELEENSIELRQNGSNLIVENHKNLTIIDAVEFYSLNGELLKNEIISINKGSNIVKMPKNKGLMIARFQQKYIRLIQ